MLAKLTGKALCVLDVHSWTSVTVYDYDESGTIITRAWTTYTCERCGEKRVIESVFDGRTGEHISTSEDGTVLHLGKDKQDAPRGQVTGRPGADDEFPTLRRR